MNGVNGVPNVPITDNNMAGLLSVGGLNVDASPFSSSFELGVNGAPIVPQGVMVGGFPAMSVQESFSPFASFEHYDQVAVPIANVGLLGAGAEVGNAFQSFEHFPVPVPIMPVPVAMHNIAIPTVEEDPLDDDDDDNEADEDTLVLVPQHSSSSPPSTSVADTEDHDDDEFADMPDLCGANGAGATNDRPCDHNCWTRSRRRRVVPGVRLRCLICRALWVTMLENHMKCPDFYAGKCEGDCGRPHILARGSVPRGMPNEGKSELLNERSLRQILVDKPKLKGKRKTKGGEEGAAGGDGAGDAGSGGGGGEGGERSTPAASAVATA